MLAIDAVTPMIANEMHAMQHWANDINRMNIQSCETAAALVGGVWPKTDSAKRAVCQTLGSSSNRFSDYTTARMGCSNPKEYQHTMNKVTQNNQQAAIVADNINLAWNAMQQSGVAKGNTTLAEWLQSLSGTVIWVSHDNEQRYHVFPSLVTDESTIKALLHGGEVTIYQCDETKRCLAPKPININIPVEHSVFAAVRSTIQTLYQHVVDDQPLTDSEQALLQATALPLLKMLSVEAAYTHSRQLVQLDLYAEVLALDSLENYLHSNVNLVMEASHSLALSDSERAAFDKGLLQAQLALSRFKASTGQLLWKTANLVSRSQVMEKYVWGQLSADVKEALFGTR